MNDRATALREAFAAFLGKEQFRKFAKQGFLKGQWKFWQETLWNEFIAANPAYASFQDELPAAIRICYLHGDELMRDKVPVVRGRTRLVTRMLEINLDKALHYFPNSNSGPYFAGDENVEGDTHEIWYCPTCRENESDYRKFMVAKDD